MGSVDRYGNMGIEYEWVKKYFDKKDEFWDSPHGLGTNMVKYLRSFLNDSGITKKGKFTEFGEAIDHIRNRKCFGLGVTRVQSCIYFRV